MSFLRVATWVVVAGACVAFALLISMSSEQPREPERWFMPGGLGREAAVWQGGGRTTRDAAAGGFLTRAFSGLRSADEQRWGRRNGLTRSLAFSHNLTAVFPPALYKTRPELFPLADGKRVEPPPGSSFWNPDIAREDAAAHAADAARKHFAAHPRDTSFALGVNDALIWGESPELLALATPVKWFRERPDYSNVVFTFMNRAAEHLSRTHPDKYLGALAYYWAENVPDFPVHPRVIPFLTADRAQGYERDFWEEEMQLQQKWGEIAGGRARRDSAVGVDAGEGRRLGIYDYVYGGGFLIPRIHTRLLAEHLRHASAAGFTDYFAEVNPNWGLDGPQPWLLTQLLQDPRQPANELLDEYYTRYFRESAGPMRRFFEWCEEQWMAQPGPSYWLKHYRNESQAIIFPSAACRDLRELLRAAESRATSATVRARVQLVSDAFGVPERFVAFHEARSRLSRLALAAMPDREATAKALAEMLAARRDFIRYTTNLRRAQPLALYPFGWDDYLKNDPVPMALLALRESGAAETAIPRALADEPLVAGLWPAIQRTASEALTTAGKDGEPPGSRAAAHELLRNPGMMGELRPPRMIATLLYGVLLPAEWAAKVEPAQFHRAGLIGPPDSRTLRISETRDTTVSQWVQATYPGLHHGSFRVRGRVSPSASVQLIFAWLDEKHRHVGFKAVRLPDGAWPEWVSLQQAGLPPKGAAWVGLGIRVQNQVHGDWVEATQFSLKAYP